MFPLEPIFHGTNSYTLEYDQINSKAPSRYKSQESFIKDSLESLINLMETHEYSSMFSSCPLSQILSVEKAKADEFIEHIHSLFFEFEVLENNPVIPNTPVDIALKRIKELIDEYKSSEDASVINTADVKIKNIYSTFQIESEKDQQFVKKIKLSCERVNTPRIQKREFDLVFNKLDLLIQVIEKIVREKDHVFINYEYSAAKKTAEEILGRSVHKTRGRISEVINKFMLTLKTVFIENPKYKFHEYPLNGLTDKISNLMDEVRKAKSAKNRSIPSLILTRLQEIQNWLGPYRPVS